MEGHTYQFTYLTHPRFAMSYEAFEFLEVVLFVADLAFGDDSRTTEGAADCLENSLQTFNACINTH